MCQTFLQILSDTDWIAEGKFSLIKLIGLGLFWASFDSCSLQPFAYKYLSKANQIHSVYQKWSQFKQNILYSFGLIITTLFAQMTRQKLITFLFYQMTTQKLL